MTHYTVLDVAPKATTEEIKAAYYSKARVHHPDKGGDATKMAELTEAWSILRDKKKRRLYDAQLLLLCKQAAPCKRQGRVRQAGTRPNWCPAERG